MRSYSMYDNELDKYKKEKKDMLPFGNHDATSMIAMGVIGIFAVLVLIVLLRSIVVVAPVLILALVLYLLFTDNSAHNTRHGFSVSRDTKKNNKKYLELEAGLFKAELCAPVSYTIYEDYGIKDIVEYPAGTLVTIDSHDIPKSDGMVESYLVVNDTVLHNVKAFVDRGRIRI